MSRHIRIREYYAGALMVLIGIGAVLEGSSYKFGSAAQMGPGFFPVVLGILLVVVGILIAGTQQGAAEARYTHAKAGHSGDEPFDLKGGTAIIAGVVSFIILGDFAGLVPATFSCVFISAIGDRTTSVKGALTLAMIVTVLGSVVFSVMLNVQFPLFRW